MTFKKRRFFLLFFFLGAFHLLSAQDSTAALAPDTSGRAWLNADTVKIKSKKHSPTKATLYSLVLPGLGQVYNHQYWKVAIIYGVGGFLVTQIVSNHHDWVQANRDLGTREKNLRDTSYKNNLKTFEGEYDYYDVNSAANAGHRTYSTDNLRLIRDGYRRDRDFYVIMSAVVYALNIVDAAVFAHLREFEVSDKLSMRFDPQIRFTYGMPQAGLSCSLNFK